MSLVALSESPHCKTLKDINLEYCSNFTYVGILAMMNSANISNLATLSLSVTKISDKSLVALAMSAHCKELEELNLSDCLHFSDAGILSIVN